MLETKPPYKVLPKPSKTISLGEKTPQLALTAFTHLVVRIRQHPTTAASRCRSVQTLAVARPAPSQSFYLKISKTPDHAWTLQGKYCGAVKTQACCTHEG